MEQLFRAERAREDERLAAAQRGEAESVPLQVEPTGGGSLTALSNDEGRSKPRRRLWPLALAGVVVAGGAVAAALAWSGQPPAVASASAPVPASPPAPVAPSPVKLRVTVPRDTRVALVDGRKHDERPLAIELSAGKTAQLQLIAEDGRELDRELSAKDDGLSLDWPAPAKSAPAPVLSAAPPKAGPPAKGPRGTTKGAGPLLADPY